MSNQNSLDRFLELDAGRALGDLTPEEIAEWKELASEFGQQAGDEMPLDDLVSVLESAMSGTEAMPAAVKSQVRSDLPAAVSKLPKRSWIAHPAMGWAVAACLAVALWIQNPGRDNAMNLTGEVEQDTDVIRLKFARLDATYGNISGEVFWSDRLQKGFMKLNGVTPNNPANQQFQLWIFDPERDSDPVDGGVFDIASDGEVIVPIDAKLNVSEPNAFAITVEQPGGVVVSERELLLALAK